MNRIVSLALLSAVAFAARVEAAPATQPTTVPTRDPSSLLSGMSNPKAAPVDPRSADGSKFPDISAAYWWEDTKIPQIGSVIGSLPTNPALGRVYSLNSSNPSAERARKLIGASNIDARQYDWLVKDIAGSTFALLRLEGGRVSGICLLANNTTSSWQKKASAIADGGIRQADGFRIGQLAFKMRMGGTWSKQIAATTDMHGNPVTPAHTESHPAAMFIECDPYSWMMATSCQTKENFEACAGEKVLPGMTMREAYLAMRNYDLKRLKRSPGEEEWVWTQDKSQTTQKMVYTSEYGTSVSSWQQVTQTVCARATISGSVVKSFELVAGE